MTDVPPRCLIMSLAFPPDPGVAGRRVGMLASGLRARGWEVLVVTGGRAGKRRSDAGVTEVGGGGSLGRIRHERERPRGSLYRFLKYRVAIPDRYLLWSHRAGRAAARVCARERPQVIMASAPPLSLLPQGLAVARGQGIPFVADFRDGWITDPHRQAYYRSRWRRRREERMEREVVEGAARVLVTSEGWADEFRARHPNLPPDHIVAVPNGYDPVDAAAVAQQSPPDDGRIRLVHTGTFAGEQTVMPVLAALAGAREQLAGRLELQLIGAESHWVDEAARLGIAEMVTQTSTVMPVEALARQRMADALLLVLTSDPRPRSPVYPAKTFEYLASERPILALLPEGDTADLLRRAGGCEILRPDDEEGIARALVDLARGASYPPPSEERAEILRASTWQARADAVVEVLARAARQGGTA